jgi:hypothetical protein
MEIFQIEEQIREFIDTSRMRSVLLKDPAGLNKLYSSLDLINDTELAILSYPKLCCEQDPGASYLVIYGILQALQLQQTATKAIIDVLDIKGKLPKELADIKSIRNAVVGHPTQQSENKRNKSSFIIRHSLSSTSFDLMTTYCNDEINNQEISIPKLIEIQKKYLIEILKKVISELERQEMEHKNKYINIKLVDFFSDINYFCGVICESASHTGNNIKGMTALGMVKDKLNNFKLELSNRGEWDDTMDYYHREIEYPLLELEKYFTGAYSSKLNNIDAYIFAYFLKEQFQTFNKIAEEIDSRYEVSYMSTSEKRTLTLQLDAEAVEAFQASSEADKEKLLLLISSLFTEYQKSNHDALKQTMDEISQKAQERGLTPEILASILEEEE